MERLEERLSNEGGYSSFEMTLLPWKRTAQPGAQTPAFEDLAMPLVPALYNLAFWLTRNAADAEDLVQETLIAMHSRRATYEPSQPLTAWVYGIARYKLIDEYRRTTNASKAGV